MICTILNTAPLHITFQIALCAALQEDIRSTADIDLGLGKEDTREIGNQPPSRIMSAACATGAIQVKRTKTHWNFEEFKLNSFLLFILMSVLKKVRKFIIFGRDQTGLAVTRMAGLWLWLWLTNCEATQSCLRGSWKNSHRLFLLQPTSGGQEGQEWQSDVHHIVRSDFYFVSQDPVGAG